MIARILVCALLVSGACSGKSAPEPPSLILVSVDTLRADHLGCYGYFRDTSPYIDQFAEQAVLFERVYTSMSTTLPAHLSLLTSTYTTRHGIKANLVVVGSPFSERDRNTPSLASLLRDAGYTTAGFVSGSTLRAATGFNVGFETFTEPTENERIASDTNEDVFRWLESNPKRPFFLFVHYFDPHGEYAPPRPFDGLYARDAELDAFLERLQIPLGSDAEKVWRWHNLYDGEIRYVDAEIHALFAKLRARGEWDKNAVVVTADHGEGLGQHHWKDHGRIYNEQLHVPLMIKFPKRLKRSPSRESVVGSIVDVVPTLVDELDLPIPKDRQAQFEGVNLMDGKISRDSVFSERVHRDRDWEPGLKYALTGADWKFFHLTEGPEQLYHLKTDPYEIRDVLSENAEVGARFRAETLRILAAEKTLADTSPGKKRSAEPLSKDHEKLLEQLEALGYVDDE